MTHGEKMAVYGKIIALQEVIIYTQNEIHKLNRKMQKEEDGSSKASVNRS